MKLNVIGVVSAILAFISTVLPWYSLMGTISDHASLFDFARLLGGVTSELWFIWVALALIAIGGLLGLVGSFLTGRAGKNFLLGAGILVILSPIIFAVGWVTSIVNIILPLFYFAGGVTAFASFGFFLAFVAAILLFISVKKHPMEAAVPIAPAPPPPPPPS